MQQALRFLEAVLPSAGLRVVASKPPSWTKGLKHQFVNTNEELVRETMRCNAHDVTAYFALATYVDPAAGRTAANTAQLQCFWMDVDYKQYASPEQAQESMIPLYEQIGRPSITVQSGGGLHAYWVLRTPLPTSLWKRIAEPFQATWQSLGIHADPISADAARILRLPGSLNYKPEYGEPREVVIDTFEDVTYDPVAFAKSLSPMPARHGAQHGAPSLPISIAGIPRELVRFDDLSEGIEYRPSHFKIAVGKCAQLRHALLNRKTLSEPEWHALLQLTRHMEDGRELSHKLSRDYPGYSREETDAKLDNLEVKGIGPTTCEQFARLNPSICEGCPHKIKSPITLGYEEPGEVEPVIVTTQHVVTEDGEVEVVERTDKPNVPLPYGFKHTSSGIYRDLPATADSKAESVLIFSGYLAPERVVTNERNNYATEIQLYVQLNGQPVKRVTIPAKMLSEKRDVSKELFGRGVIFMSKNAMHILTMLQLMTQQLQATRRDAQVADQMGWQDDGSFVIGTTGYAPLKAPTYDLPVPPGTKSVARFYEPAGSLTKWKEAANVYARPGAEAYQFALCYGAAGVVLPMAKLSGVVLSLYSQQAGRGKSTVGYAALSWWGNPEGLKSQSKDTNNALFNKASRHKNLPILMDEITDKPNWELEDLVYFMSQGREKESLTADRTARPIMPGWELPVISTSNNSIRSKLQSRRGDTQGLFARIIEVPMDLPFAQTLGFADRMTLRTGFVENYGLAGPKLVEYVMNNMDMVRSMVDTLIARLDGAVHGDSAFRFWVTSAAATLAVATSAKQLKLVDYDIQALTNWTVALLRSQRTEATASIATSDDVLAQFLETNANRIIVSYLRNVGPGTTAPAVWPEDGVHGTQLVGRAELPARSLFVSVPAFLRFCNETGFDLSSFTRNAAASVDPVSGEVLLKSVNPVYVNLGKGTKTASARTKALEFNLMHPSLREFATGIDSKIGDAHNIRSVK